jgi:hypothetical protein
MNKRFIIAAVLTAAALTGILSTSSIAVYADESETEVNQNNKLSGVASGDGDIYQCVENNIDSFPQTIVGVQLPICSDAALD